MGALISGGSDELIDSNLTGTNRTQHILFRIDSWSGTDFHSLLSGQAPQGYWLVGFESTGSPQPLALDNDGSGISGSTILALNTWYTLTIVTNEGSNAFVYLDGVLEISSGSNLILGTNSFRMGNLGFFGSYPFLGTLDGYKSWQRSLTAGEVLTEVGIEAAVLLTDLKCEANLDAGAILTAQTGSDLTSNGTVTDGDEADYVGGASTISQSGFRFYDDTGLANAAVGIEAEDTIITLAVSTPTRLRFQINATGSPTSQDFTLQYRKVGDADSEWENI